MSDQPASSQKTNSDPILVDYDNLLAHPIVRPDPFTTPHNPEYLSRHPNALWWLLIFSVIIVTAAALLIADASNTIVDPPCE